MKEHELITALSCREHGHFRFTLKCQPGACQDFVFLQGCLSTMKISSLCKEPKNTEVGKIDSQDQRRGIFGLSWLGHEKWRLRDGLCLHLLWLGAHRFCISH